MLNNRTLSRSLYRSLPVLLALLILLLGALPIGAQGEKEGARAEGGNYASIENDRLRLDLNDIGLFTLGTTGGDLVTPDDDNKTLMYGFRAGGASSIWSSYPSLMVNGEAVRLDEATPTQPPVVNEGVATTHWSYNGVDLRQEQEIVTNPYTGQPDTARITYCLSNPGAAEVQAGMRLLNDVQVAGNDGAPYFVPGAGNVTTEAEWLAGDIPDYWRAFESPEFDPALLRAQGINNGYGATPPDRFVIARWGGAYGTDWDYTIDPSSPVTTDSATLHYWGPHALAPGALQCYTTFYGLAGQGGGGAWIDAPQAVDSCPATFTATAWVANNADSDWLGGNATISLPEGLSLVVGQSATQPIGDIPVDQARSTEWEIHATAGEGGATYEYSVTTTFASGPELTATHGITVPPCAPTALRLGALDVAPGGSSLAPLALLMLAVPGFLLVRRARR